MSDRTVTLTFKLKLVSCSGCAKPPFPPAIDDLIRLATTQTKKEGRRIFQAVGFEVEGIREEVR